MLDSFYGYKIYCVLALSRLAKSSHSTAHIIGGGVGESFVEIEIHSGKDEGLAYIILIFGRLLNRLTKRAVDNQKYGFLSSISNRNLNI